MKKIYLLICFCFSLQVSSQCIAEFDYDAISLELILLNNSIASEGETVDYMSWDFGNGETFQGPFAETITYTYAEVGTYEVCLNILDSDLCENETCELIEILSCGAHFTYTNNSPVIFEFSSTSVSSSEIESYEWTLDGVSEGETQTLIESILYSKIVCLEIITDDACVDQYCEEITPICYTPENVVVNSTIPYQIMVEFDTPINNPSNYNVLIEKDGETIMEVALYDENSVLINSPYLMPCEEFWVSLKATCGSFIDDSPYSEPVAITSYCDCPSVENVEVNANNLFELSVAAEVDAENEFFGYHYVLLTELGDTIVDTYEEENSIVFTDLAIEPCENYTLLTTTYCGDNAEEPAFFELENRELL